MPSPMFLERNIYDGSISYGGFPVQIDDYGRRYIVKQSSTGMGEPELIYVPANATSRQQYESEMANASIADPTVAQYYESLQSASIDHANPESLAAAQNGYTGTLEELLADDQFWNDPSTAQFVEKRNEIGNAENLLADLIEGASFVGGGALGINALLNPAGVGGLFGGSETLGSIGGTDTVALNAADQAAGLLPAETFSTGATALPVDLSTVVGTDLPALDTIGTGANEMSIWDDIANEVFEGVTSGAGDTLSNTAVEEYLNSFPGMEQLYGSGDVTDLVTTLSNATGDLDLANSIATSFGDSAGVVNQFLSGLQGENLTKAVNAIKTVTGTGGAGSLLNSGSIKSVLSGLMGLYGAQNQSQDLTEAAKYLTENANPYRSYIQNGTVGGPGSVTSFMQGFQQPANQMASASGGYNDLLKTSYTDPLSIWNSPEMSALNNIFKQQIDRRDSVAGRNSQYGARAVEMQNNFLTNALPKYRTGLNDALTATSNAATNFGKVATPPGTGEAPASVGNLLQGAATAGNNYDAVGSILNNLFS